MNTNIERIQKRLAEIEEREKKVRPGPWEVLFSKVLDTVVIAAAKSGFTVPFARIDRDQVFKDTRHDNAEFIAASRTDIPALRKALEKFLEVPCTCRKDWFCYTCSARREAADILEGK